MPKLMTIISLLLSVLLVVVFAIDLTLGIPFRGASMVMDVTFIICGGVLAYLSWSTMREQV